MHKILPRLAELNVEYVAFALVNITDMKRQCLESDARYPRRHLMRLYAQIITSQSQPNNNPQVLNMGFELGILPMFY